MTEASLKSPSPSSVGIGIPIQRIPLHRRSARSPILHGAFSASLASRMAGMHILGTDCLLHGMNLRFFDPVVAPVRLLVRGTLVVPRRDIEKAACDHEVAWVLDSQSFLLPSATLALSDGGMP